MMKFSVKLHNFHQNSVNNVIYYAVMFQTETGSESKILVTDSVAFTVFGETVPNGNS